MHKPVTKGDRLSIRNSKASRKERKEKGLLVNTSKPKKSIQTKQHTIGVPQIYTHTTGKSKLGFAKKKKKKKRGKKNPKIKREKEIENKN